MSPQLDDAWLIDVEPQDRLREGEPKGAAVEAATEVQDNRIRLTPKEIRAPVVELFGAQHDHVLVRRRKRGPMDSLEVIVDPVHRLRGRVVTQNGAPRTAFIRAQIQRDEVRL